jgi:predicted SAM-dependent methyltransferase
MKKIIKNFPFVYHALLAVKHRLWSVNTAKGLKNYLLNHKIRKLQLGAGSNNLTGWFNTDYFPRNNIFFVDVTKPFPIASSSFNFVFSEHHIEHISYKCAIEMLKEVFRIMKPGGYIRISTPDLQKYINSYNEGTLMGAEIDQHSKDWIYSGFYNATNYIPVDDYFKAHFVNDIFLNYEHQFIYDYKSLTRILENAGFSNVVNCSSVDSIHPEFNNIETHVTAFDRYFTLTVEAEKPLNE